MFGQHPRQLQQWPKPQEGQGHDQDVHVPLVPHRNPWLQVMCKNTQFEHKSQWLDHKIAGITHYRCLLWKGCQAQDCQTADRIDLNLLRNERQSAYTTVGKRSQQKQQSQPRPKLNAATPTVEKIGVATWRSRFQAVTAARPRDMAPRLPRKSSQSCAFIAHAPTHPPHLGCKIPSQKLDMNMHKNSNMWGFAFHVWHDWYYTWSALHDIWKLGHARSSFRFVDGYLYIDFALILHNTQWQKPRHMFQITLHHCSVKGSSHMKKVSEKHKVSEKKHHYFPHLSISLRLNRTCFGWGTLVHAWTKRFLKNTRFQKNITAWKTSPWLTNTSHTSEVTPANARVTNIGFGHIVWKPLIHSLSSKL